MAGKKVDLAKKGIQEYWSRITTGNKVSFITFSDSVHTYPDTNLTTTLPGIKATGMTALYSALTSAFDMAAKSGGSGWILLLTDGHPTDVTKPEPYSALKPPQGFKMIEFGIGEDYPEDILKTLADASRRAPYPPPPPRTGRLIPATPSRENQRSNQDHDPTILQSRTDPTCRYHRIHETFVRAA